MASGGKLGVALTGPPGIGKTTYVKRLVSDLQKQGCNCEGFVTAEVRNGGRRIGFDVVTLDGKEAPLSRVEGSASGNMAKGKRPPCVGPYAVDVPSFEAIALPSLQIKDDGKSVLVIDEIGKMEMFSNKFVDHVRNLLRTSQDFTSPGRTSQNTSSPTKSQAKLLVTIPVPKGKPIGLVEEIRNHKEIKVFTITTNNRNDDAMRKEILALLTN